MKIVFFLALVFALTSFNVQAQQGRSILGGLFSPKACPKDTDVSKWTDCVGVGRGSALPPRYDEYEGEWRDGKPNGKGRAYSNKDKNGSYREFKGNFENGLPVYGCTGPVRLNKQTQKSKREPTGKKIKYFGESTSVWDGIAGVELSGSVLIVRFSKFKYYPEYEADEERSESWQEYEPSIGRVAGNALLLGIPILLAPIDRTIEMVGCSEAPESFYYPIDASKQETGDGQWRMEDMQSTIRLLLQGLGDDVEVKVNVERGVGVVRLSVDRLMALSLDNPKQVKIACLSCQRPGIGTTKGLPPDAEKLAAKEFSFEADFRSITADLISKVAAAKQAELERKQAFERAEMERKQAVERAEMERAPLSQEKFLSLRTGMQELTKNRDVQAAWGLLFEACKAKMATPGCLFLSAELGIQQARLEKSKNLFIIGSDTLWAAWQKIGLTGSGEADELRQYIAVLFFSIFDLKSVDFDSTDLSKWEALLEYATNSNLSSAAEKRDAGRKLASLRAEQTRLEQVEAKRIAAEERKQAEEEAREKRRLAAEQALEEKRLKQEEARVARLPVAPQNEFTGTGRLSLDGSKTKCAELGFKPATEGFGKCVLQLSK